MRPGQGILVTSGAEVAIQVHMVFMKHLLPGNAAQLQWWGCHREGHSWRGQQLQSREEVRRGRRAGGCGKEAPGTIPGSVRAQLAWLEQVQLSSEGNGSE